MCSPEVVTSVGGFHGTGDFSCGPEVINVRDATLVTSLVYITLYFVRKLILVIEPSPLLWQQFHLCTTIDDFRVLTKRGFPRLTRMLRILL